VVEAATVTDSDGNAIDTSEFFGPRPEAGGAEPAGEEADNADDEAK
jgi:trigger factor